MVNKSILRHGAAIHPKFVRLPEVCAILGIGRTSVYKLMNDPDSGFPAKVDLPGRIAAWRYDDIEAWADSRPSVDSPR